MEECGRAHVKGVIIVSAGFKETGAPGKALEEKILKLPKNMKSELLVQTASASFDPEANLTPHFWIKCQNQATSLFYLKAAR